MMLLMELRWVLSDLCAGHEVSGHMLVEAARIRLASIEGDEHKAKHDR